GDGILPFKRTLNGRNCALRVNHSNVNSTRRMVFFLPFASVAVSVPMSPFAPRSPFWRTKIADFGGVVHGAAQELSNTSFNAHAPDVHRSRSSAALPMGLPPRIRIEWSSFSRREVMFACGGHYSTTRDSLNENVAKCAGVGRKTVGTLHVGACRRPGDLCG